MTIRNTGCPKKNWVLPNWAFVDLSWMSSVFLPYWKQDLQMLNSVKISYQLYIVWLHWQFAHQNKGCFWEGIPKSTRSNMMVPKATVSTGPVRPADSCCTFCFLRSTSVKMYFRKRGLDWLLEFKLQKCEV